MTTCKTRTGHFTGQVICTACGDDCEHYLCTHEDQPEETPENPFNVHGNRTADGVVITVGLRVWTNEMVQGVVISDDHAPREGICCGRPDHYGQMFVRDMNGWFTDHTQQCDAGGYCGHNHWFTVETANGTKSFDGERLATVFEGRRA